ncbi:MarR family winged helix-turn-helix transcriptional regulator [Demequina maris]|uniref:MarR family winged helix-turn-helix transcriptional regulator n=1 Tax=Demequina maris TaxID=1638982 RepID=UPI000780E06B|nr:MarR family winged helix-turn-helix transcriptional regulator [Demequina maris]
MNEPTTFLLRRVVAEMDAYADELLRREFGTTFATFMFLAVTAAMPGADVTTLGRAAGMSKAAASKRIPPLVEEGLLTSSRDPHHGRRLHIAPTERALALVGTAGARLEAEFASLLTSHAGLDEPTLRGQVEALAEALAIAPTTGEAP